MISASPVASPSAERKRSAEIGSLAITKTFITSCLRFAREQPSLRPAYRPSGTRLRLWQAKMKPVLRLIPPGGQPSLGQVLCDAGADLVRRPAARPFRDQDAVYCANPYEIVGRVCLKLISQNSDLVGGDFDHRLVAHGAEDSRLR